MFRQVVATGAAVKSVKEGDYAVFTVRRPCGPVRPLPDGPRRHVPDGEYGERGIRGLDGYKSEFAVHKEQYRVPVPVKQHYTPEEFIASGESGAQFD